MSSEVWWPSFCGNGTIYDAFWSDNLTVETYNPDFTSCFQATVILWVPCGFLWISLLPYSLMLHGRQTQFGWKSTSRLNWIKIVCCFLICLVEVINICKTLDEEAKGQTPALVFYVEPLIRAITLFVVAILLHVEFCKASHTSGFMFVFWTFSLMAGIITFRSKILQAERLTYVDDVFRYVTFFVYFGLILVEWLLTMCVDYAVFRRPRRSFAMLDEKTPLLAPGKQTTGSSEVNRIDEPSLENYVNSFLNITLSFFFGMVAKGFKKVIDFDDVYDLLEREKCASFVPIFLQHWHKYLRGNDKEKQSESDFRAGNKAYTSHNGYTPMLDDGEEAGIYRKPSPQKTTKWMLIKAMAHSVGWSAVFGNAFRLLSLPTSFFSPLLLRSLLQFLEDNDPYVWKGYSMAVLIMVSNLINSVFLNRCIFHNFNCGMQIRSMMQAVIFRKAMRLSAAARRQTTLGQIVNLMAVDAERFLDLPTLLSVTWTVPLTLIISTYLMWQPVGAASLAGVGFIILAVPFNGVFVANKIRHFQTKQMRHKDSRLKVVNEILLGIKVLKLYAWEPSFRDKILAIREKELQQLKYSSLLNAVNSIVWNCMTSLVCCLIFCVYILTSSHNVLSADTAFFVMSLINVLNWPMSLLAVGVSQTGQAYVSLTRINAFLNLEEIEEDIVIHDQLQEPAVKIINGRFNWGYDEAPTLTRINLTVETGALVAVVGQVGAGKSSLIYAILGEMLKNSGKVYCKGSISYVPQEAWIQNNTVKGNILFSKSCSKSRYEQVLEACALMPDLKILSDGDMTEIGEKGINLSGGQKQRVSLARAVYQDEDVCLLDDPLSAVDAHVGKHLFEHVIGPQGLLGKKTRILVTHGLTYLHYADLIVVLVNGQISETGTFETLVKRNGEFAEFLRNYLSVTDSETEADLMGKEKFHTLKEHLSTSTGRASNSKDKSRMWKRKASMNTKSDRSLPGSSHSQTTTGKTENINRSAGKLIEEEFMDIGTVKWGIIRKYMVSGGICTVCLTIVFFFINLASLVLNNIWLSEWTNDPIINGTRTDEERNYRLGVYVALVLSQVLFNMLVSLGIAVGSVTASRVLHKNLLNRIVRAPMAFFDTTPTGRILNRMSKDMDGMDVSVPWDVNRVFFGFTPVCATLIIVTYTTPWFLIAAVPLGCGYALLVRIYIKIARQLRRIDSVRKSPLISHFGESIMGAISIRAYSRYDESIQRCDSLINDATRCWYMTRVSQRWLSLWSEMLASCLTLVVSVLSVIMRDTISPGLAGLAVTFAMQMGVYLGTYLRASTELETYMVSVERIVEYSNVVQEAEWNIPETKPSPSWPSLGCIEYRNYETRYRPGLDCVLKDISFQIQPKEKIGVVGRTGAGKSSLALSLFRIIESTGGAIYIDNDNIADIGLQDLRSRLTIIPQDPVIFSGTLRSNLDPFGSHTDDELWEALALAHLKNFVISLPDKLEYECGENGEGLSVGQRQLVCLGRAVLRHCHVLVLDEATAAIDLETDELIQNTIRSAFSDCTILTIAHRLNTIIDYDRVLVMHMGNVVEFDNPTRLLEDKGSLFYDMATKAGLVNTQ